MHDAHFGGRAHAAVVVDEHVRRDRCERAGRINRVTLACSERDIRVDDDHSRRVGRRHLDVIGAGRHGEVAADGRKRHVL